MSKHDASRIQELFLAALDLPPEQRDPWLVEQCGDDRELLNDVRSLLEHDSPADDPLEQGLDDGLLSDVGFLRQPDKALHVRCPHCRNPIELVDDHALDSVTCSSCGSSFSLIAAEKTKTYAPSKDERIAHFNVVDKLGVGAFGAVYRAFDESLSRTVAIKIPRKGQLSTEEAEKFFREARTAAQLRHPNIVSVHEVGRDDDRIYIVSDFVDGLTLTDWLTGMQPTPRETAGLLIKVARALHHAHEQGVIHRDLKPGNIMLDRDSEPHLMDFGLAKREAGEITMTMDGQILGTPAYMSPEQARGEGHHVDRRADIYALGVILFEMLTGDRPFRGNTRMLLHQVLTEEAPSPRKLNASVPRDLETICLKCLEKSPDQRYGTTDEVADELQRYLDHQPITARPLSRIERGWRWCKRKPVVAGLSSLLAVALLTGTTVATHFAVDANHKAEQLATALEETDSQRSLAQTKAAEAIRQQGIAEKQRALAAKQQARAEKQRALAEEYANSALQERDEKAYQLYLAHMSIAQQEWQSYHAGRTRELLSLYLPEKSESVDRRDWEWNYLWRLSHSEVGSIQAAPPDSGPDPHLVEAHISLVFTPDGRALVTGSDTGRLGIWSTDGWQSIRQIQAHREHIIRLAVSADGRLVATAGRDKLVKLWNTTSWTEERSFPGHSYHRWYGMALSAQADRIAIAPGKEVVIYDTATGRELQRLSGHRQTVRDIQFSADGTQLITAGEDNATRLWDLQSGRELHRFDLGSAAAISPDQNLVVTGGDGSVAFWDTGTGEQLAMETAHTDSVNQIRFSSDGQQLVTAANGTRIRVWDVESRQVMHTFVGHGNSVSDVDIRPGLDQIASCGWDGLTRIWDTSSRQELVRRGPNGIVGLQFSPTGAHIALCTPRSAIMFDMDRWQTVWKSDGDSNFVFWTFPLSFDFTGRLIATGRANGVIRIRDVESGTLVQELRAPDSVAVTALRFLPDGGLVIGDRRGQITFWSKKNREFQSPQSFRISQHSIHGLAVSPDGTTLAVGGAEGFLTVVLWDLKECRIRRELRGHQSLVQSLAFSTDGRILLCGGREVSLTGWNAMTGELVHRQRAHSGSVYSIDFARGGQRYASSSNDGTVKLWDTSTNLEVLSLRPELGQIKGASFSPNGKFLAVGGDRGFVIYDSRPLTPAVQSEPWAELLRSETKARSMRQEATQFVAERRLADAIALLEECGKLPGQTADYRLLRDLYARTLQWDKALAASRQLAHGPESWEQLLLLYMAEEYDEFRESRPRLLAKTEEYQAPWQYQLFLMGALLLPLDETDHAAVRVLAERNAKGPESWNRGMVGKAMYGLGEFRQWYDNLPDDSDLKKGHELRLRMTAFRDDPGVENRQSLEEAIEREQNRVNGMIRDGVLGRYWQNYVERFAWLAHAHRMLNASGGPSK